MGYDIPNSEKRALGLSISIVKPDGSTVKEVDPNRGNEALAYSGMHYKIKDALELLLAYSAQLERMEHKRFTKAEKIKNELFTGGTMRLILHNVIRCFEIDWDRRLELAESMFDTSSEFILSQLSEASQYQKDIVEPIRQARKKLIEIVNEIRTNREMLKAKEEMERRYSQKHRIMLFKAMTNQHNIMCNFCTRTSHDESLLVALREFRHEGDCPFKQDQDLPNEQLISPEILSHYAKEPPLKPSKAQNDEEETMESRQKPIKKKGRKPKY